MKKLIIMSTVLLLGFTSCKKDASDPVPVFKCGDNVTYGGQNYKTVKIGSRCWFAENLNIGTQISKDVDASNNNTIEKYCYGDVPQSCTDFGGLYTWDEMMGYTTEVGGRGICPEGWHIPSSSDFDVLFNSVGDDAGKLLEGGESGFGAQKAGYFSSFANIYSDLANSAYFTTSREGNDDTEMIRVRLNNNGINKEAQKKFSGYSVRCLKN